MFFNILPFNLINFKLITRFVRDMLYNRFELKLKRTALRQSFLILMFVLLIVIIEFLLV